MTLEKDKIRMKAIFHAGLRLVRPKSNHRHADLQAPPSIAVAVINMVTGRTQSRRRSNNACTKCHVRRGYRVHEVSDCRGDSPQTASGPHRLGEPNASA